MIFVVLLKEGQLFGASVHESPHPVVSTNAAAPFVCVVKTVSATVIETGDPTAACSGPRNPLKNDALTPRSSWAAS